MNKTHHTSTIASIVFIITTPLWIKEVISSHTPSCNRKGQLCIFARSWRHFLKKTAVLNTFFSFHFWTFHSHNIANHTYQLQPKMCYRQALIVFFLCGLFFLGLLFCVLFCFFFFCEKGKGEMQSYNVRTHQAVCWCIHLISPREIKQFNTALKHLLNKVNASCKTHLDHCGNDHVLIWWSLSLK